MYTLSDKLSAPLLSSYEEERIGLEVLSSFQYSINFYLARIEHNYNINLSSSFIAMLSTIYKRNIPTFYYGTPQLRKESVNRNICIHYDVFIMPFFFHYTVIHGTFPCVN